jgi:hypothetical protein
VVWYIVNLRYLQGNDNTPYQTVDRRYHLLTFIYGALALLSLVLKPEKFPKDHEKKSEVFTPQAWALSSVVWLLRASRR